MTRQPLRRAHRQLHETVEELYSDSYRQIDNTRDQDHAGDVRDGLEPLAVTVRRSLRIELAWGGPSAWLDAEVDHNRSGLIEVVWVTFHFADWFDHAEQDITEDEAPGLWPLAEHCAVLLPEADLLD